MVHGMASTFQEQKTSVTSRQYLRQHLSAGSVTYQPVGLDHPYLQGQSIPPGSFPASDFCCRHPVVLRAEKTVKILT